MFVCPKCDERLARTKTATGLIFVCPKCSGRAVSLSQVRRQAPDGYSGKLWSRARQGEGKRGERCPICRQPTVEVPVPVGPQEVLLDVCTACCFVWFDPGELEGLSSPGRASGTKGLSSRGETGKAKERLPLKVREQIAMAQLESVARRAPGDDPITGPEDTWQWIPALLGMPVECEVDPVKCWPWLTWGLSAALVVVFAATFSHLNEAAEALGLIPAELWRMGGLTLVSSFFLHAGLMHVVGNTYFLLVFGDNVEDYLGRWKFLALLVVATVAGGLAHAALEGRDEIPCVGASGGISGVITAYALAFPRARLGIMFRYWFAIRWLYLPAYAALILWFLMQCLLAYFQVTGVTNISAAAHLGGAAVGVVAWLVWRRREG